MHPENFTQHTLKTDPEPFAAVLSGKKTHEIRYNDRGFEVGDRLHLVETVFSSEEMAGGIDVKFTGRQLDARITHIQQGYGLRAGWRVLSIVVERPHVWREHPRDPDDGSPGYAVCADCGLLGEQAAAGSANQFCRGRA